MPNDLKKLSTTHRLGTRVGNLNVSISISDDLGTGVGADLFDAICALTQDRLMGEFGRAGQMDVTVTTVEGTYWAETAAPRAQRHPPEPAQINSSYDLACRNYDQEAVA